MSKSAKLLDVSFTENRIELYRSAIIDQLITINDQNTDITLLYRYYVCIQKCP